MPRVALDLNNADDRRRVRGDWRFAPGYVPGEPNEGLQAQIPGSPARLAEYDDGVGSLHQYPHAADRPDSPLVGSALPSSSRSR